MCGEMRELPDFGSEDTTASPIRMLPAAPRGIPAPNAAQAALLPPRGRAGSLPASSASPFHADLSGIGRATVRLLNLNSLERVAERDQLRRLKARRSWRLK